MTTTDPLVQAATFVTFEHTLVGYGNDVHCICGAWRYGLDDHLFDEHRARATVTVLVPLIRAQVAEEIDTAADHPLNRAMPTDWRNGMIFAADIASEGTDCG